MSTNRHNKSRPCERQKKKGSIIMNGKNTINWNTLTPAIFAIGEKNNCDLGVAADRCMQNIREGREVNAMGELPIAHQAVSYTHLDVYKRQAWRSATAARARWPSTATRSICAESSWSSPSR